MNGSRPASDPASRAGARWWPRAQLLAAAGLFSTGGVGIKLCALGPWQVAAGRAGVAAVALAVLAPAARRGWTRRTLAVAVPYAATIILFTLSNRNTTAANAIFLQDAAPLYVLLFGPWLLGERIAARSLACMAAMAAGLAMLFMGGATPGQSAPDPALGNALAAVAGVTWALTLVGLRWLAAGPQGSAGASLAAALAGNGLAALCAAPLALPFGPGTATDWLLVVYLGVCQIACAYLLITAAMVRVPALESSLLLLAEPVMVPVWAWLALGEATGALALAGGALVLAATALNSWFARPAS